MIELRNTETGAAVGTISEEQLAFLTGQLEEESSSDRDYYTDAETLEMFEDAGCDAALLALLRTALGDGAGIELRWSRV